MKPHCTAGDFEPIRAVTGTRSASTHPIPSPDTLTLPAVHDLITAAIAQAAVPLPPNGHGELIIQSIAAKQKPRRKP